MTNGNYITDYHLHSTISPDGNHSMTEMAEAAVAAGRATRSASPTTWSPSIGSVGTTPPRETGSYDWAAHGPPV